MQSPVTTPICTAAMGGMTLAQKAERALLAAGIAAEIVSLSPDETKRGCAFGVNFPCTMTNAARDALRRARIAPSQYLERTLPS